MSQKIKTAPLTGVDLKEGSAFGLLTETFLVGIPFERQTEAIEAEILRAGAVFNDTAVCDLLDLLERVIHLGLRGYLPGVCAFGEERGKHAEVKKFFYGRIRNLWWKLPDVLDDVRVGYYSVLPEAKKKILQEITTYWMPELNSESVEAFRFLIAVFAPLDKKFPLRPEESEDEGMARGRRSTEEQRKWVIDIIQRHTGNKFSVHFLECWMQQMYVPAPILEVLLKARARNGGVSLAMRDIRNCKILAPFKPEERSPEAVKLMNQAGQYAAKMDKAVADILIALGVGWENRIIRDEESNEPIGRLEFEYGITSNIIFIIIPDKDCPCDKHNIMLGKIAASVKRWQKQNPCSYQLTCRLGNW